MSLSNVMSGISGAFMGFLYTGTPMGAVVGFAIGFGMSLAADALAPDAPSPGQPQLSELNIPTADEGLNIPDALGTVKSSGNIFQVFGSRSVETTEEVGGKSGGGETVSTGYRYYLSVAIGVCLGPIDYLYSIYAGDDLVWEGNLQRPEDGSYELIELSTGELVTETMEVRFGGAFEGPIVSEGAVDGGYEYVVNFYDEDLYDTEGGMFIRTELATNPLAGFDDYQGIIESGAVLLQGEYIAPYDTYRIQIGIEDYISHTWTDTDEGGTIRIVVANKFPDPADQYQDGWFSVVRFVVDCSGTHEAVISDTRESMGNAYIYFGTDTQVANPKMVVDKPLTPGYRGLCYIFFDDVYIGGYNRFPAMRVVFGKFPALDFNANHRIGDYDYNPSHAIWYIMTNSLHAHLPEGYMDSVSYSAGANILYAEGRGISMLFDRQQTAMAYVTTLLEHIGAIMRYSGSGDLKDE